MARSPQNSVPYHKLDLASTFSHGIEHSNETMCYTQLIGEYLVTAWYVKWIRAIMYCALSRLASIHITEKSLLLPEYKGPESHYLRTPVTTPTLNLLLQGISSQVYGTSQEITDAKVYLLQ